MTLLKLQPHSVRLVFSDKRNSAFSKEAAYSKTKQGQMTKKMVALHKEERFGLEFRRIRQFGEPGNCINHGMGEIKRLRG